MIRMLVQQGGANPQAFVQNILRNNPQFAKEIQGKNPQQFAQQLMQQNGIDINQVMSMFNGGRR